MAPSNWQSHLDRWIHAGLVDPDTAARIRTFESQRTPAVPNEAILPTRSQAGLRWPVAVALALGGLLVGAGILLFVSAHWDKLSPLQRLSLVTGALAVIHVGGAFSAPHFPALATTLHAVGTVGLGGAIAMAGQIFHLEESWPNAILLWAIGAWAGVALLRSWPQVGAAALLTPAWLTAELGERSPDRWQGLIAALLAIAFLYIGINKPGRNAPWRRCLNVIGCVSVLLLGILVPVANDRGPTFWTAYLAIGFVVALLGWLLRGAPGGRAITIAVCWAAVYLLLTDSKLEVAMYAWAALGSVGMVYWGMEDRRGERINLGMAGFALTVLFFYFSNVMSALDRSLSLIVLGVLFLAGGWQLERLRRRLIGSLRTEGGSVA